MAPTFCNRCGDTIEEGCDLRDKLAELDVLLERLILKRYDLKRKINRPHSPIVRQLPLDVTSTIFEFCLPDFTDHLLLPHTEEDVSIPLSLGAICSYWREIAWSTPSLWSSFVVRVTRKHNSHIVTGIAQEWLVRSGQLPLSIRIFSEINNESGGAMNLKFQLTCPRLERASLSCTQLDEINIHWDGLTHLTLHSIPIVDSFLILRETPPLVFCKVSGSSRHEELSTRAPVLTSLRSLQLITSFPEDFLNNLIVPELEEFGLPNYYNPSMEVITSFLRRSACSLRSLSMIFSVFPPYFEGFMRLLQSIPSLNKLSIISIASTIYYNDVTLEDYDPRNLLQLVAKAFPRRARLFNKGFYRTSRFWNIPEICVQGIMMTHIPCHPPITLYMVLFIYLNSTSALLQPTCQNT
jgi:hypothetical protein